MSKILVAGGAGFIGSHLVKKLLGLGYFIYCMDNLTTGTLSNIRKYTNNNNFEFINHDIVNPLPQLDVDIIYNLACPASPIHYQMDPVKTMKTSVIGTYNIIDLALLVDKHLNYIDINNWSTQEPPQKHAKKKTNRRKTKNRCI